MDSGVLLVHGIFDSELCRMLKGPAKSMQCIGVVYHGLLHRTTSPI